MNNKEMCAIILVEVESGYPNRAFLNRKFEVSYKDNIEGIINSIIKLGIEKDIPFTKVRHVGYSLSSFIWTENEILNHIKKYTSSKTKKR